MSLDFDLRAVHDHLELYEKDDDGQPGEMLPKYKNLILLLMSVGIGEINDKNVGEVFERLQVLEAVDGPFLRGPDNEAVWYKREDVERLCGIKTNIYPKESKAKFMKKMGEGALRRLMRDFEHKRKGASVQEEARG